VRSPDSVEVTGQLQLADASLYPVAIRIVPALDGWSALTVDFGGPEVAARLVGPSGSDAAVEWLADTLPAGGRMTRADYALLLLEEELAWPARIHLAPDAVWLDRPPLMLWVTSSLAARTAAAYPAAWKAERQWDGALLLIPEPLPARAAAAPSETPPPSGTRPPEGQIDQMSQIADTVADAIGTEAFSRQVSAVMTLLLRGAPRDRQRLLAALELPDGPARNRAVVRLLSRITPDPEIVTLAERVAGNLSGAVRRQLRGDPPGPQSAAAAAAGRRGHRQFRGGPRDTDRAARTES
jgi:hypothetical protein